MAKRNKPEFYSQFMEKGFFPGANKITKFKESDNYWIFKTGQKAVKVKKRADISSTVSLEEIFCREMIRRLQKTAPSLEPSLAMVKLAGDIYRLDYVDETSSTVLYYAIVIDQLADRYFLDNILAKGKLTDKIISRVAEFLFQLHSGAEQSSLKTEGTADALIQKLNDLIYQSKKYLGETITRPMIDMTLHPLEKYINDNRKLIQRRVKKGLIKEVHGCFIPRKIHVDRERVVALTKTNDPLRDRFGDIASDIADLTVALIHAGEEKMADTFVSVYCDFSRDTDTGSILPIYQALKCLSQGLQFSVAYQQSGEKTAEETKNKATAYYEQAINIAHGL